MFKISTWDVKEPTHYSKRVGREVPGVVAVLLSSKCGGLGVKMFLKGLWCMRSRTQKQPQVKKEICRVLEDVNENVNRALASGEHQLHVLCMLLSDLHSWPLRNGLRCRPSMM